MELPKTYNGLRPPAELPAFPVSKYWDVADLFQVPRHESAAHFEESCVDGLESILYDGMSVDGVRKPVFAYIGFPSGPVPPGGFPAVVLVHGGGGTAYPAYVKLWNSRGYVAIAMDLYNSRPQAADPGRDRILVHGAARPDFGTNPGQVHQNIGDIVRAHSLLLSLPGVNPARTGAIGISWGSVFVSVVACIDDRLQFVLPVYGHGFFGEGDGSSSFCKWSTATWDPGRYLSSAKVPLHWFAGTNDLNFLVPAMQRSWDTAPTTANRTLIIGLPHSHIGYQLSPTFRIVDAALRGGVPLPVLGRAEVKDGEVLAAPVENVGKGIKLAQLCFTTDDGPLCKRPWNTAAATVRNGEISAVLPEGTVMAFLAAFDEQDADGKWFCAGTSNVVVVKAKF